MDVAELKTKFDKYMKSFNITQYSPFGHGTTTDRAEQIKKEGLLRRVDCDTKDHPAQCDIWTQPGSPFKNKSENDRTYFESCMEVCDIGLSACEKAYEADHRNIKYKIQHQELLKNFEKVKELKKTQKKPSQHDYKEKTGKNFRDEECKYLVLKNIEKYKDKFIIDEDSSFVPQCLKDFYSEKEYKHVFRDGSFSESLDCQHVFSRLPVELTDLYDLMFIKNGNVSELIDKTPSALFSLTDWGTVAVQDSIPPEDIDVMNVDNYLSLKGCCRKEHEKLDTGKYHRSFNKHVLENIKIHKDYVKEHEQEFVDRINSKIT